MENRSDLPEKMTKNEFVQAVQSAGLSHYENDLLRLSRNSIDIRCEPADNSNIEIGQSKLGGLPDLPPEIPWPKRGREPFSFLAQFRMRDVARYDIGQELPSSGMMYFFYDAYQDTWGYKPTDGDHWKVVYYDGELSELCHSAAPAALPEEAILRGCRVTFSREDSFPPWESYDVEKLGMNKSETSAYGDVLAPLAEYRETHPTHRLLGHPDIIQNDMQLECQLVSHGLYCGDASGYEDPRAASLESGASGWRLLLQIDTDDETGMMWDDSGRLYFWIPDRALVQRDFSRVWVILQSY